MNRAVLAIALAWSTPVLAAEPSLLLSYRQPAQHWTEALPIGNGRLGAMVFGGTAEERLQLNEDTLWTGAPHEYQHEGAVKFLPELRRLLAEGRQKEAEELATREFMSVPLRQKAYQPMADLRLRFPGHENATDYRRELDLDSALASVQYRMGGVSFARETLSSHPDQVLVERLTASRKGSLTFTAALTSPHEGFAVRVAAPNEIVLSGRVTDGAIRFEARLRVVAPGGRVAAKGGILTVEGADAATLLVTAATNFVSFRDVSGDPGLRSDEAMRKAAVKDYSRLRAAHVADHQWLFRRVTLDLGTTPAALLPTDERIAAADKRQDPSLVTLAFQFGRYLLIASSRPGDQPANLQGIWNESLTPPWDSKYTVNINTEMNYWPAEVANLAECAEPLFALLDDLVISGRKTAEAHYGARGWVLHHNTDLWRGAAPINASNHGIWPTGGAWLTQHLWWHYQFSLDREFLKRRAYPVMKQAALFFVDALVRDPRNGFLISGPSNSPENGGLVMGPTMDHQIIRALFQSTAEAARILGVDAELQAQLDRMRAEIAPNQIGRHGQLQEWLEDKDDPENKHRHVSHLWGVFPGDEITPRTPELFAAARRSLQFRGDDGTGWSLGWKIAFWARFLDGDHALRMIERQLTLVREQGTRTVGGGTYPNLFDAHPPFQIDGNFALTAGVSEMLLQSHGGEVVLLPALPKLWPNGSVKGLRARGGLEIDLVWRNGTLLEAGIVSTSDARVRLRSGDAGTELELKRSRLAVWRPGFAGAEEPAEGRVLEWTRRRRAQMERPEAYRAGWIERNVLALEKAERPSLLDANFKGFYPRLQSIASGSRNAIGVRLWQPTIGGSRVSIHGSAFYSLADYRFFDLQAGRIPHQGKAFPLRSVKGDDVFELGQLGRPDTSRLILYGSVRRQDYRQLDFFGLGSESAPEAHSNYRLADTSFELVAGYQLGRHVAFTLRPGYVTSTLTPGTRADLPAAQDLFTEATAPGLTRQPDYFYLTTQLSLDGRDEPGNPHRGGMLGLQYSRFEDRKSAGFRFDAFGVDARGYLPLGSPQRVLALRAYVARSDAANGSRVPFYMQPFLGGSHTLRGFPNFRFRSDNVLLLQAEYRWEPLPAIELVLFADFGRATSDGRDGDRSDFLRDFGVGLRLKSLKLVLARLDVAWSREQTRVFLRFSPTF